MTWISWDWLYGLIDDKGNIAWYGSPGAADLCAIITVPHNHLTGTVPAAVARLSHKNTFQAWVIISVSKVKTPAVGRFLSVALSQRALGKLMAIWNQIENFYDTFMLFLFLFWTLVTIYFHCMTIISI